MTDEVRGFSIPFRVDAAGSVAEACGPAKLRQNVLHLLRTRVGERVMRREYGGGIHQLVHDPNDDALRALVRQQIARLLARWEPRIQLREVEVGQHEGTLVVHLRYLIRQTREVRSLSVPVGLGAL